MKIRSYIFGYIWHVLWICLVFIGSIQAQDDGSLLLQNARLILGDGALIERGSILIEQGVFSAVAEEITDIPADTEIIDMSGKTILPALIDAHAHLAYQSSRGWGAEYYGRETLESNLQQYAYFGFSTVFSAGSDADGFALQMQNLQESGGLKGARFLFAAGMAPPGQGPNNQFLIHTASVEESTGDTILRGLINPEQARQAVREVSSLGIKFIKIWVDDRVGSQEKLSAPIYRAVIDEARQLDLVVFVHQQTAIDMPDLLDAGVKGFLHGRIDSDFTDEIARQTSAASAFVVPNLGLGELRREAIGDDPFLAAILTTTSRVFLSAESSNRELQVSQNSELEEILRQGVTRLVDAGVDIVLGTDAGALPNHPFGYSGHRELQIFTRLGLTPMQAIMSATGIAAKHLQLSDTGLIKVGFRADLLVLNENPLENISHTQDIHRVILAGEWVDRESIRQKLTSGQ